MDLSVIVVNYNAREHLQSCLSSIQQHAGDISCEQIVVDNASSDDSAEYVATNFPAVHLLRNATNLGFGRACNQAFAVSRGDFLLLLNPDARLAAGSLAEAVRYLRQHPEIGILGGKVLNPDGSLQPACRRAIPTPRSAFFHFAGLSRMFPRHRKFGEYNLTFLDADDTAEVGAVSGSFLMARREVMESILGFDERFFIYGEDLDLCLRAVCAGKKVVYWPSITAVHSKGGSVKSRRFASWFHFYHAMWLFYRKHYYGQNPWWKNGAVYAAIWLSALPSLFWNAVKSTFLRWRKNK
ncbi:MAG TPA: glycosyltransferase family 2 protein [Acidobacteriota bacterium]|jgi:hypothetical protein